MRSIRAGILAGFVVGGVVTAQDRGPTPVAQTPQAVRLDASREWLFALNGYTFTRLLRLKPDGTFEEYAREHMFVGVVDAGRWRQSDAGDLLLCSHHRYDGTLETLTVGRRDGLTWIAPRGDAVETRLLEEYREHREGTFVSAVTPVSVDAATFAALLGSTQGFIFHTEMNQRIPREAELDDMRPPRIAAPQCGPHEDLARPLPPDRE